jgi:tetratricopeptide (TPR) repeat protein
MTRADAGLTPAETVLALAEVQKALSEGNEHRAAQALQFALSNGYERRALAASKARQWTLALELFRKAAEYAQEQEHQTLLSNAAICCLNLGLEHEKARREEEALAAFTKAVEFNPAYAKAHYARAKVLARTLPQDAGSLQSQVSEAIESLQRAISLDYSYRPTAQRDADFDALRNHPAVRLVLGN